MGLASRWLGVDSWALGASGLLLLLRAILARGTRVLPVTPRLITVCAMRKILKSDRQPLEIKPQEKSVWICMCGLSKNQPYCDGAHKTTAGEEEGKTYEYDREGHRNEV